VKKEVTWVLSEEKTMAENIVNDDQLDAEAEGTGNVDENLSLDGHHGSSSSSSASPKTKELTTNVSRELKCLYTSVDGLKSDFNKSIKDLNECVKKSVQNLNISVNSSMRDLNSNIQFNNTLKIEKMIMYFIVSEFLFIKEMNLLF